MRLIKLAIAAALAFGTLSVASTPGAAASAAAASTDQRGDWRRDDDRRSDWRDDRGRHRGWRNNRGRHRGWYNRRVCRTYWRHGHRQRVCRIIRYRR